MKPQNEMTDLVPNSATMLASNCVLFIFDLDRYPQLRDGSIINRCMVHYMGFYDAVHRYKIHYVGNTVRVFVYGVINR